GGNSDRARPGDDRHPHAVGYYTNRINDPVRRHTDFVDSHLRGHTRTPGRGIHRKIGVVKASVGWGAWSVERVREVDAAREEAPAEDVGVERIRSSWSAEDADGNEPGFRIVERVERGTAWRHRRGRQEFVCLSASGEQHDSAGEDAGAATTIRENPEHVDIPWKEDVVLEMPAGKHLPCLSLRYLKSCNTKELVIGRSDREMKLSSWVLQPCYGTSGGLCETERMSPVKLAYIP